MEGTTVWFGAAVALLTTTETVATGCSCTATCLACRPGGSLAIAPPLLKRPAADPPAAPRNRHERRAAAARDRRDHR